MYRTILCYCTNPSTNERSISGLCEKAGGEITSQPPSHVCPSLGGFQVVSYEESSAGFPIYNHGRSSVMKLVMRSLARSGSVFVIKKRNQDEVKTTCILLEKYMRHVRVSHLSWPFKY